MNKLKFDPQGHVYTYEGEKVPSVTQVLQDAGFVDLSYVSEDLLVRANAFGTAVHEATAQYDREELDIFSLDPQLQGCLDAWIKFRKDTGFMPEIIEQPMFSEKYCFAGTPDRIGVIGMGMYKTQVDIKTGIFYKSIALQLAGYEMLHPVKKKIAVQLLRDGTYKIASPKMFDISDKTVFLSCLNIYNYKKRSK